MESERSLSTLNAVPFHRDQSRKLLPLQWRKEKQSNACVALYDCAYYSSLFMSSAAFPLLDEFLDFKTPELWAKIKSVSNGLGFRSLSAANAGGHTDEWIIRKPELSRIGRVKKKFLSKGFWFGWKMSAWLWASLHRNGITRWFHQIW
ncbi:hypothetical protein TNCT_33021 [Trichonephila clavata]|uniref:Uncharacterized protein n=1 Tax=Trichonephila clavata TaxID=2740835 RepID=A0A8X6I8X2_TRICU|nr:hypothetical protein TNCT_33021 [Trichonephila clavata]